MADVDARDVRQAAGTRWHLRANRGTDGERNRCESNEPGTSVHGPLPDQVIPRTDVAAPWRGGQAERFNGSSIIGSTLQPRPVRDRRNQHTGSPWRAESVQ